MLARGEKSETEELPSREAKDGSLLQVNGVTKKFGGTVAVSDVSFQVESGEALAIIGPNGAGKSTLLKMIAGIHRPSEGSILLGDQTVDRIPTHRVTRLGIAMASQIPRPFRQLTVRDNVRVGSMHLGTGYGKSSVDAIIDRCGLAAKASRPAGQLAVLDLKRLEIARALATNPRVLLLDEVGAGLVGKELEEVIELIRLIHAEGRTAILVEHVERVVASLVKRVIVLDWGSVLAEGSPREISRNAEVRDVYLGAGSSPREHDASQKIRTPMRKRLLSVTALSAGYGPMLAARDIDLTIDEGELVAVLGANGAGKTTLASAISGLIAVRSGSIEFAGEEISSFPAYARARAGIAHSPEGRRVFVDLTVEQNLLLPAHIRTPGHELETRLDLVKEIFPQLDELSARRAGQLSGGQQQMLAVGRALMGDPRLIICDEISLGLAPIAVDALYDALERMRSLGKSILLIEQNVHRSLEIADRAYILERGMVSYAGKTDELLDEKRMEDAYFGNGDAIEPELAGLVPTGEQKEDR